MGFFFKEKKEEPKEEPKLQAQPTSGKTNFGLSSNPSPQPTATVTSGNNWPLYIEDELRKKESKGPDYLKFADALKKMDGVAINEKSKYELSHSVLASMGFTKDQLIESAQTFLSTVETLNGEFANELAATRQEKITNKQLEIENDKREIEEMTQKIQEKSTSIQVRLKEINDDTFSLQTEEAAYNAASQQRADLIRNHITNIQTTLS